AAAARIEHTARGFGPNIIKALIRRGSGVEMRVACFCLVVGLVGCSDSGGSHGSGSGAGGSAGSTSAGGISAGGTGAVSGSGAASGSGGTAGFTPTGPVELPAGSRELDDVVNLVDADAAEQLEQFLLDLTPIHEALREGLTKPLNLFLEHYLETYDFVFFVTDHVVENVMLAGKFEAVNRKAAPGGGNDIEIALGGYETNGRLKGVIGIPYFNDFYPPFSHEMGHYWAVDLDDSFGFGLTLDQDYPGHWGTCDVNGQLGGFDGSTLKCETPPGATPPDCTPLGSGRTRYVVGAFGAQANGFRGQPFAPLELYLMGLAPATSVPASIQQLIDAHIDDTTFDAATNTVVVEANSEITTLPFADIVARHGNIQPLAEPDRHFSAAFVVVSAAPASDEVMADVATWAAVLGKRTSMPPWNSFEEDTGGLATLDTTLGQRRDQSDPAPPPRVRFECDPLAQDCGRPELGCYLSPTLCALSAGAERGQPCDWRFECAPGLDCVSNTASPDAYFCEPYCDPNDGSSAVACQTFCGGDWLLIQTTAGEVLGAICMP
ncbi:MAG TPA: hypothetical protein VGP93_03170, partial [Polyangiaceae bacterium]|nr:hypothetical protein [Polyangiaceae bacterium]